MDFSNNQSDIVQVKLVGRGDDHTILAPVALTLFSTISTIAVAYLLSSADKNKDKIRWTNGRSTPLPGYGILGDKVNELIEVFLDALAIYVHNDRNWDCPRRMLCEANQRAGEYSSMHGVVMYFLSLSVSFLLRDQKVSESMEAMRKGRHGLDCISSYPRCPFRL